MAEEAFETDSATFKKLFEKAAVSAVVILPVACVLTAMGQNRGLHKPSMVNTLTKNCKSLGLSKDEEYWLAGAVL